VFCSLNPWIQISQIFLIGSLDILPIGSGNSQFWTALTLLFLSLIAYIDLIVCCCSPSLNCPWPLLTIIVWQWILNPITGDPIWIEINNTTLRPNGTRIVFYEYVFLGMYIHVTERSTYMCLLLPDLFVYINHCMQVCRYTVSILSMAHARTVCFFLRIWHSSRVQICYKHGSLCLSGYVKDNMSYIDMLICLSMVNCIS